MSIELNETQNAILGAIGSSIETTIQYPLNIIKNKFQYNSKISLKFNFLYKGYFINMSSLAFITGFQFYYYKHIYDLCNNDFISSLSSGLLSGIIASPTELFIIQKFNYKDFYHMHKELKAKYGILNFYNKGMFSCMMRESIYTFGMISMTPYIEHYLNKREHHVKNGLIASIISGFISGTLSHPFDTIKTIQQFNLDNKGSIHPKYYFRGYLPRIFRIIGTYFIINESNIMFQDKVRSIF